MSEEIIYNQTEVCIPQNIGHQNINAFIYNFILVSFQGFRQELYCLLFNSTS